MHAVRSVGLVAVALLLINATHVQAQDATLTLTVPAGPTVVPQGGNVSIPVKVKVGFQSVVCAQAGTASVALKANDASPLSGLTVSLPGTVTFTVPQGAWTQAGPYSSDEKTVYLNATLTKGTIPNHDHPLNITATFGAGNIQGCTILPAGATYDATAAAATTLQTGAGGAGGSTNGNGTGTNGSSTSKAAFSLPLAIEVAMLLGLGVVVSRRKQE